MEAILQDAPMSCPGRRSYYVCMSCQEWLCDAQSDASRSIIHSMIHRSLPPGHFQAPSGRRPTQAPPGRSKLVLVNNFGGLSHRRQMARYVRECRPLRKVHHATVLDGGHIVNACLIKGGNTMLGLTHYDRLTIPSCKETCRRVEYGLPLYVDRLGHHLDDGRWRWIT